MPELMRTSAASHFKRYSLSLIKFVMVGGIIYWLFMSGKLDMSKVIEFFADPLVVGWAVLNFIIAAVLLGAFRWYCLLRAAGSNLGYWKVLYIHWIGFFFNIVMPGAVGGDLVKAIYVIRNGQKISKTKVMMTVLLDRILGMSGLFLLGAVMVAIDLRQVIEIPELRPLLLMLVGLIGGVILLFIFVMAPAPKIMTQSRLFSSIVHTKLLSPAVRIVEALRQYRDSPAALFGGVGISMFIQFMALTYCWYITRQLSVENVDFTRFSTIFPIGILVTAVPLAPGGIGVGHIAFEKLFMMAELKRGADMFNIYLLGNLCLSMTGIIPYLFYRRESIGELVETVQREEEAMQL
jgi:uncharacterized protein (TIRG00374 family)